MNEELGIPELKKLLAAAQREISVLKTQISISTPQISASVPILGDLDDNLECPQSESDVEEDPTPQETFPIRIAELEDLLENQRIRSAFIVPSSLTCDSTMTEENKNKILEGELFALRQIVAELEAKLLEVSFPTFLPYSI